MSQFIATVSDKQGKTRKVNLKTGSGHLTTEQMMEHIKEFNMFPDAAKVEVAEVGDNPANSAFAEAEKAGAVRTS